MISSPFRQSSRSAAISRACVQEVVSSILGAPAYHRGAPQAAGVDTIARAEENRGGCTFFSRLLSIGSSTR